MLLFSAQAHTERTCCTRSIYWIYCIPIHITIFIHSKGIMTQIIFAQREKIIFKNETWRKKCKSKTNKNTTCPFLHFHLRIHLFIFHIGIFLFQVSFLNETKRIQFVSFLHIFFQRCTLAYSNKIWVIYYSSLHLYP